MIEKNINLYNILENLNNMEILTKIWLFAWIIIFAASLIKWEDSVTNWPFGLIIIYILSYPIYKRWDKYLSGVTPQWPSFWLSISIILFLTIFWLILFIQIVPKMLSSFQEKKLINEKILEAIRLNKFLNFFTNKEAKTKKWLKNFSIIRLTWIDAIGYIPFSIHIKRFTLRFFINYLTTPIKKKVFFGFFLILPRLIGLTAIFYDFFIEKQLYWFPKVSLLIIISLISTMLFFFVEKSVNITMDNINKIIYLSEEEELIDVEGEYRQKFLHVRQHLKNYVNQKIYDELKNEFIFYNNGKHWCITTRKTIFNDFYPKVLFILLTLEIVTQIIIIQT